MPQLYRLICKPATNKKGSRVRRTPVTGGQSDNVRTPRKGFKQSSSDQSRTDDFRKETVNSYTSCLRIWHQIHFAGKFGFNSKKQTNHFNELFHVLSINQLPKAFKGLLADSFSIGTKQIRPDVPIKGELLFYPSYRKRVFRELKTKRRTTALLWDLLHSKALAKEAHESFVN